MARPAGGRQSISCRDRHPFPQLGAEVLPDNLTHPLLDMFTGYGTQLFNPISSYAVEFNTLFIIDRPTRYL